VLLLVAPVAAMIARPTVGLRFFKWIRLSPGLTINLSRGGEPLSIGRRGPHFNSGNERRKRDGGAAGTELELRAAAALAGPGEAPTV
jgi:hypothetical protein